MSVREKFGRGRRGEFDCLPTGQVEVRLIGQQGAQPERLAQRLEALGATVVRANCEDGVDHYGVAMRDPEGNEFDIN